jgi:hypothetical protein
MSLVIYIYIYIFLYIIISEKKHVLPSLDTKAKHLQLTDTEVMYNITR